jgi:hypothetical protein
MDDVAPTAKTRRRSGAPPDDFAPQALVEAEPEALEADEHGDHDGAACALDGLTDDEVTSDDDLPYVVLFAGVAPDDVEAHAAALREALG